MSSSSFLVTGGAGFLGGSLVHRLVNAGNRVRVLDDQSRGSLARLSDIEKEVELICGDIRDPETVRRATQGIDCVCHFAFVNGTEFFYSKPEVVLDVALKGIVNIVDASLQSGVKELVLASSSEVYQTPPMIPTDESAPLIIPDPHNPRFSYAAGKIISEIMVLNYGLSNFKKVIIVRPHNVYGPEMGWEHVIPQFVLRMRSLCRGTSGPVQFPIQGTGKETRSFVFIDDFIDGLLLAMEKGRHRNIYHIGTGEEITIEAVVKLVGEYFNREVILIPGELAKGSPVRRCPDIHKLSQLGYRPKVPFRKGLAAVARWYDQNADRGTINGERKRA